MDMGGDRHGDHSSRASDGREYRRTHPWLTFSLNLRDKPPTPAFWIMLGECQSKCEHLAGVPLRPSTAKELMQTHLVRGTLASAAIEGNTLTEAEARAVAEGARTAPPSRAYLEVEVKNILRVVNGIAAALLSPNPPPLTTDAIKRYNAEILKDLEVEAHVVPGEIPTAPIGVGRYRGAPRADCEHLLGRLVEWLNTSDFASSTIGETGAAILKAVMAHLYIAWIHPFGDGNGRTARAVEVHILMSSGLPQPACHLLSNHYNQTRDRYYRELDLASNSGGDVLPFLSYAIEGLRDGLRSQIEEIRGQQWDVAWENYVHQRFQAEQTGAGRRRRDLLLALGRKFPAPVPRGKLLEISPKVAKQYASLNEKTLARDIVHLRDEDLVLETPDGIVAAKGIILAFLPRVAPGTQNASVLRAQGRVPGAH